MSRFANSIAAGLAAARRMDGEAMVYASYESGRVNVNASPARTLLEAEDTSRGITTRSRVQDFLIAVEELTAAGGRFEPDDGDKIERTVDNLVLEYEVMPPSDHEPSWRYSDDARSEVRVHTKLTDTRAAEPPPEVSP